MTERTHRYQTHLTWIGGGSAAAFGNHDRSYRLDAPGKPAIAGSLDQGFRGDARRWNPEDLLVASLLACHHLWYMGLCAAAGIAVGRDFPVITSLTTLVITLATVLFMTLTTYQFYFHHGPRGCRHLERRKVSSIRVLLN